MNQNDLLSKLEEIQDSSISITQVYDDTPTCVIDAETRQIQIPEDTLLLGVESDEKATRVRFQCPKIVGNDIDLTKLAIRINYRDVEGNIGQNIAENITDDGDTIIFDWIPSRGVTRVKGTIQFIVCAVNTSDGIVTNEWNTTLAKAVVLEGIEPENPDIPYEEQEIIAQLIQQIKAAQKQTAQDAEASSTNAEIAQQAARAASESESAAKQSENAAKNSENSASQMADKVETSANILINNEENFQAIIDNLDAINAAPENAQKAAASAEEAKQAAQEALGFRTFFSAVTPDTNGNLDPSRPMTTAAAQASWTVKSKGDRIQSVQVNGFTQQAGTGDPSPTNVRTITVAAQEGTLPITLTGSQTATENLDLTAPLCNGDKVESCVPSGCDKAITVDGRTVTVTASGSNYVVIAADAAAGGNAYAEELAYLSLTAGQIVIPASAFPSSVTSAQTANTWLQSNQQKVWYQSTAYTEQNDIPVQLETHANAIVTVDGTNTLFTQGTDGYSVALPGAANGAVICDRFANLMAASNAVTIPASQFPASVTSLEQANTWAQSNPVTILYQLATHAVYARDPVTMAAVPYTAADSDQTAGTYVVNSQDGTTVAVSLKAMQDGGDAATLNGMDSSQFATAQQGARADECYDEMVHLYKVTFSADNWGSSSPYTQTATVTPVNGDQNVTANSQICGGFGVRDDFSTDATYHLQRLIAADLNRSKKKSFGNGTLTLTTNNKPRADVELYFLAKEPGETSFGLSFPGGGSEIVMLWENKTTGSWSGRKVSLDLTAYDAVLIVSKLSSAYTQANTQICLKGLVSNIIVSDYNSNMLYSMRIAGIQSDGVQFGEAYNYGTSAINNNYNWPYRIYGVKF